MANSMFGKKAMKSALSKRGGHVHGRVSWVHRGAGQSKKYKVTSRRQTIKYSDSPHTETSIRTKIRNTKGNKYRPAKEKSHTKHVGRKVRRR